MIQFQTPVTPPSAIAHYKIAAKLGEGGMGAVNRPNVNAINVTVLPCRVCGNW
jgi:hypothetical protein